MRHAKTKIFPLKIELTNRVPQNTLLETVTQYELQAYAAAPSRAEYARRIADSISNVEQS